MNARTVKQLIALAQTLDDSDPIKHRIEAELINLQGFSRLDVLPVEGEDEEVHHDQTSLVEVGVRGSGRTVGIEWRFEATKVV